MIILLKLILLTSIWVLGLTIATQPSMIFGNLREWANNKNAKIYEPIILCHFCMPSIHSLIGYLFGFGIGICGVFEWRFLILYPLVAMGSSLFSGIMWAMFNAISSIDQYYKNLNHEIEINNEESKQN